LIFLKRFFLFKAVLWIFFTWHGGRFYPHKNFTKKNFRILLQNFRIPTPCPHKNFTEKKFASFAGFCIPAT
jgi:hypothetical protein